MILRLMSARELKKTRMTIIFPRSQIHADYWQLFASTCYSFKRVIHPIHDEWFGIPEGSCQFHIVLTTSTVIASKSQLRITWTHWLNIFEHLEFPLKVYLQITSKRTCLSSWCAKLIKRVSWILLHGEFCHTYLIYSSINFIHQVDK